MYSSMEVIKFTHQQRGVVNGFMLKNNWEPSHVSKSKTTSKIGALVFFHTIVK